MTIPPIRPTRAALRTVLKLIATARRKSVGDAAMIKVGFDNPVNRAAAQRLEDYDRAEAAIKSLFENAYQETL